MHPKDNRASQGAIHVTSPPSLELRPLLLRMVGGLLVLAALLGLVGLLLREPALAASRAFVDTLGPGGVALGFFLADGFNLPLPHDVFLALGLLGGLGWWSTGWSAFFGSLVGSVMGYGLARALAHTAWGRRRLPEDHPARALMRRHGLATLLVGCLLPLPFSLTVWAAGALRYPFLPFFGVVLLRVVRVFGYLAAIQLGVVHLVQP